MASEDAKVKLFGAWTSSYTHRVQLGLKLKGVEFEYVEEELSNKSPLLLKYNPVHKKVPVLLHGERPVAESVVILEYVDETWKENPIMPQDSYERAIVRFWCRFADEKVTQFFISSSSIFGFFFFFPFQDINVRTTQVQLGRI